MTILTTLLVNSLSALIGTFLGNFTLLWIIGRQAQAIERENLKRLEEYKAAAMEMIKEDIKKKREYIKMES